LGEKKNQEKEARKRKVSVGAKTLLEGRGRLILIYGTPKTPMRARVHEPVFSPKKKKKSLQTEEVQMADARSHCFFRTWMCFTAQRRPYARKAILGPHLARTVTAQNLLPLHPETTQL
jgi:hypothetical protein